MKSTGIVRKIDELGRIVIPKELRGTLDIDIKDPMEIYVNGEEIILKNILRVLNVCSQVKLASKTSHLAMETLCLAQKEPRRFWRKWRNIYKNRAKVLLKRYGACLLKVVSYRFLYGIFWLGVWYDCKDRRV